MKVNRKVARAANYAVIGLCVLFGVWLGSVIGGFGFEMIEEPVRNDWLKYRLGTPLAGGALVGLVGIIFGDILEKHIKFNP